MTESRAAAIGPKVRLRFIKARRRHGRTIKPMQIEQPGDLPNPARRIPDDRTEAAAQLRPSEHLGARQEELPARPEQVSTPAATFRPMSELPASAWRVVLGTWLAFFAVMVLAFGGSKEVLFVLGVVTAFAGVFFGVPVILLRINKRTEPTQSKRYLDTLNGRLSKSEALAQIIMVPALLTLGVIAIGYFATHQ
jgi:hypothetical protein